MGFEYDVIVIGGGAAGLTAAGMSASFGAKTLLIEAKKLGGDCTWYGCVPSKALLKAAKIASSVRQAKKFGLNASLNKVNIKEVLSVVHKIQNEVYTDADDPTIYEGMGVVIEQGYASFIDTHTLEITSDRSSSKNVTGKYFVICTGSSPVIPPIEGLKTVEVLTNENIFQLEELPESLAVIGAGPIGIEMGQAFNRLGSKVSIIDYGDRILAKDELEVSSILKESLVEEGITFCLNSSVKRINKKEKGVEITFEDNKSKLLNSITAAKMLVSAGRKANISNLNLKKIGVKFSKRGIEINNKCATNISNIYSCGDVAGVYQFTHYAEHMAKVAISNILLKLPFKLDLVNVPWVTYTDPEVAHIGMSESSLKEKNISFEVYKFPFSKIDRAITESEKKGLIKVLASKGSGKIYGADIVGHNAGEMIAEYLLAIRNKVSLKKMADTIHPYPTYGFGNRRAADQWYVRKQSRLFVKILQFLFGYKGKLPDTSDPYKIV